jgi:hypothetical protein
VPLIARLAGLQNPLASVSQHPPIEPSAAQVPPATSGLADSENAKPDQEPCVVAAVVDDDLADPSKLGGLLLQRGLVTPKDLRHFISRKSAANASARF